VASSHFHLILPAVERLFRYERPIGYTSRLASEDLHLSEKTINGRQAVIAVGVRPTEIPSGYRTESARHWPGRQSASRLWLGTSKISSPAERS
jgi:hypothetical protein